MGKPFLPPGYKAPAGSSDFMKLQEGVNRFRIMGEARIGWEGWKDGKPFRREGIEQNITEDEVDTDDKFGKDKPKINHIWVFPVFDYVDKKMKIFQITQKTIMKAISGLVTDPDWGDPTKYDIGITRVEGKRVTYAVTAYPPKPVSKEVLTAQKESKIDIDQIFKEGGDDKDW